jgi:hypothetical protein
MLHAEFNYQTPMFEMDGGFLEQQPSFDMDNDYGFFEMDDLEDMKDENSCSEEDDRSASDEAPSPILTPSIIEQLCIPSNDKKWECLFSSSRDGPSFGTFMRHVRGHVRTIVVAKAEDGRVYGAYATDPWSGRGRTGGSGAGDVSFLFEVPSATIKKGHMSPLAQPSSQASLAGSFIPGLERSSLGSSPTCAMDFDMANLSLSPKNGANIDIVKSSDTTCGFKQVCQLGSKFIGISDGEVSLAIESSFTCGTTEGPMKDRKEFDVVEFEVYGLLEG